MYIRVAISQYISRPVAEQNAPLIISMIQPIVVPPNAPRSVAIAVIFQSGSSSIWNNFLAPVRPSIAPRRTQVLSLTSQPTTVTARPAVVAKNSLILAPTLPKFLDNHWITFSLRFLNIPLLIPLELCLAANPSALPSTLLKKSLTYPITLLSKPLFPSLRAVVASLVPPSVASLAAVLVTASAVSLAAVLDPTPKKLLMFLLIIFLPVLVIVSPPIALSFLPLNDFIISLVALLTLPVLKNSLAALPYLVTAPTTVPVALAPAFVNPLALGVENLSIRPSSLRIPNVPAPSL